MTSNLNKYPSMASMQSMVSSVGGVLPTSYRYYARKPKPDKPYGLSFLTRMNRTHRGPGEKYLYYALACACVALLFFMGGALYFGHRNVSRMMVYRTEVLGALMVVVGIVCVSLMGRFIYRARVESNMWRAGVRFRPEGLYSVVAVHEEFGAQDGTKLATGSYGPKALKRIPKPGAKGAKKKRKKGRSHTGSKSSLATGLDTPTGGPPATRMYEKKGQTYPAPGPPPATYGYNPGYNVEGDSEEPLYPVDSYPPRPLGYGGPNPAYVGDTYYPADSSRPPVGYRPPHPAYSPPEYEPGEHVYLAGAHPPGTAESEL